MSEAPRTRSLPLLRIARTRASHWPRQMMHRQRHQAFLSPQSPLRGVRVCHLKTKT